MFRLSALLVVAATAAPEDQLAKEMTHDLEMNPKTIGTVAMAMAMSLAMTFWCGFRCGVLWSERKFVGKAKVFVYHTGQRYHFDMCTATLRTSSAKEVTITQAEELRKTPCLCPACEKAWKRASNPPKL